jgi:FtsZ-binding cell division protein ZapB
MARQALITIDAVVKELTFLREENRLLDQTKNELKIAVDEVREDYATLWEEHVKLKVEIRRVYKALELIHVVSDTV